MVLFQAKNYMLNSSTLLEHRQELARFFSSVLSVDERGLEPIDAQTLTNVLFYELLDNVHQHAECDSWALVAACARPANLILDINDFLDAEQPYLSWLTQKQTPLMELVLGDYGRGVVKSLGDSFNNAISSKIIKTNHVNTVAENIILWAFDRWSTSGIPETKRGTRGLYRVDRIAKKYQGLISLRSSNAFAGFDHGGPAYDQQFVARHRMSSIPGTILKLWLPPFQEQFRIRHEHEPSLINHVEMIRLGLLTESGLQADVINQLKKLLIKPESQTPSCIFVIVEGGQPYRDTVETVLRQMAELRHPAAIVLLGLPGGWGFIESAIDSVNQEHEAKQHAIEDHEEKHFDIWDPVLVIGPSWEQDWAGVSQELRLFLRELTASEQPFSLQKLKELIPDAETRGDILRRLRNDTTVVRMLDDNSIESRLGQIQSALCAEVAKRLKQHVSAGGVGVGMARGAFLTPTLHRVSRWLDTEKILDKTTGANVALFVLSGKINNMLSSADNIRINIILSDTTNTTTHISFLRDYLGVDLSEIIPSETDASIPIRNRVVDPDQKVIIYADIISSGECVRRCIHQVLRDDAIPVAVACLFDARQDDNGEDIEEWGVRVPVISVASIDISAADSKEEEYINPISRRVERESPISSPVLRVPKEELNRLIVENGALYISHIGRPLERHFTFYLNAIPLLETPRVCEAFDLEISDWVTKELSSSAHIPRFFDLWYPQPDPNHSAPALYIAKYIRQHRNDVKDTRIIRREPAYGHWFFAASNEGMSECPNVIIVDWGSLTGCSVIQMIQLAARSGAEHILVCVFVSQLPSEEEAFLTSLREISVLRTKPPRTDGILPGFAEFIEENRSSDNESDMVLAKVSVRFLSRFPIQAFHAYDCPLCQLLEHYSQAQYPTDFLREYAKEQKRKRLRLRARDEILNSSPKDFDNHEIVGTAVLDMATFRSELMFAMTSTRKRYEIASEVADWMHMLRETETANVVLSAMQFLSIETQWLKRPPLCFAPVRQSIASTAQFIVNNCRFECADRLNAAVVLRTASKPLFAKSFAETFLSSINSEALMGQLLHDAFTYLMRDHQQSKDFFAVMERNLHAVMSDLTNREPQVSLDVVKTVKVLLFRARSESAKAGVRHLSQKMAWSRLKDLLTVDYIPHDPVPSAIMFMQPGPDAEVIEEGIFAREKGNIDNDRAKDILLDPSIESWLKSLDRNWGICCEFLDFSILPLLSRMLKVLQSEDVRRSLGVNEAERLLYLVDAYSENNTLLHESDYSKLVRSITEQPCLILNARNWEMFREETRWYRDVLLSPGGNDVVRESRLIHLLKQIPASLSQAIKNVTDQLLLQKTIPHNITIHGVNNVMQVNVKVFCTEALLNDCVREFLMNVKKHLPYPEAEAHIYLCVEIFDRDVVIMCSNTGTVHAAKEGDGLRLLSKRLEAFNANLEVEPRPRKTDLSFQVSTRFMRGD
jgi:orotate phosphoribosyltransferase-like protein